MKIAVIGPFDLDDLAHFVGMGFQDLGHEIEFVGSVGRAPKFLGRRSQTLVEVIRRDPLLGKKIELFNLKRLLSNSFDLVVSTQVLRPDTVNEIRKGTAPVCLWFPDHASNYGPLWLFQAPYEAVFLTDPLVVTRMNNYGMKNVHYLPEACYPKTQYPIDGEFIPSIAVVGNIYPTREFLLERLLDEKVKLQIFGGSFLAQTPNGSSPLFGGYFYGDFTHRTAFNSSSIRQICSISGFEMLEFISVPPNIRSIRGLARRTLWMATLFPIKVALAAETGRLRGHIVTSNIVFKASI